MAYLEIIKDGKTVRRQRVADDRARAGFTARISGMEPVKVKLGETTRAGGYELRVVEELTDAEGATGPGGAGEQGPRLEGYELRERLGEGGMGVVWKGIQQSTQRTVAVKFLGRRAFGSDRSRKRFEREVRLCAKLEHPAIVRVYDSGLSHGAYFYTMELIDGVAIDQFVTDNHLGRDAILRLFKTLCDAVQHAHDRGVIHRDLKPGNVLVTKDGQPHVLDFGLAKSLIEESGEDDHHVTMSLEGVAAGTPAYMSPEQAAGRHSQTDGRTDVWSIGVMLYRMLVGQPPHDLSGTRFDVTKRIVDEEIRSPRSLSVSLGADLEGLLRKALARNPEDRYSSVGDFGQDIENYLGGKPLIARKATVVYRFRKRMTRHSKSMAAAGAFVVLLIVVSISLRPGGWIRARLVETRIVKILQPTTQLVLSPTTQITATAPSKVTAADVAALASQFAQRLTTVKAIDPHDGVCQMISELSFLDATARQFRDQKEFSDAVNEYQAALNLCDDIVELDKRRGAQSNTDSGAPEASEALKPLLPFCGKFSTTVRDLTKPGVGARPGTTLARMRLGGRAFTMEHVETNADPKLEYRELVILYDNGNDRIGGIKYVHGMGARPFRNISVTPDSMRLVYGPRANEVHLMPDGTMQLLLKNIGGAQDTLIVSDCKPGWDDNNEAADEQLDPDVDALAEGVIAAPGNGSFESQCTTPIIRLDFAVRNRDWKEARELLNVLETDYPTASGLSHEALPMFAWKHLVEDVSAADVYLSKRPPTHFADGGPGFGAAHVSSDATPATASSASPQLSAAPKPAGLVHTITNSIGMALVEIKPGSFLMGSPSEELGRRADEVQHRVTLTRGFFIGATDVTEAQWKEVMGSVPEGIFPGDDLPVQCVGWNEAIAFCDTLGKKEHRKYRLPTEAEWEYACRAGGTSVFYDGDGTKDLGKDGWYRANSSDSVHRVGERNPNAWGLYDMLGNVGQWCSDWYAPYPTLDGADPPGPSDKTETGQKVVRGGSWRDAWADCRCASRRPTFMNPTYGKSNIFGFRVVLEVADFAAISQVSGASSESHGTRTVDLLKLIDPTVDALKGSWSLSSGGLTTPSANVLRVIEVPYAAPAEYDYQMDFEVKAGGGPVALVCASKRRQFAWSVGGNRDTTTGFIQVTGASGNSTITKSDHWLGSNQRHSMLVKVRTARVEGYLDGKLISGLDTDYSNLNLQTGMELRRSDILGIQARRVMQIESLTLTEITGQGKAVPHGAKSDTSTAP